MYVGYRKQFVAKKERACENVRGNALTCKAPVGRPSNRASENIKSRIRKRLLPMIQKRNHYSSPSCTCMRCRRMPMCEPARTTPSLNANRHTMRVQIDTCELRVARELAVFQGRIQQLWAHRQCTLTPKDERQNTVVRSWHGNKWKEYYKDKNYRSGELEMSAEK